MSTLVDAAAALAVLGTRALRDRHRRDHEQHAEGEENTYGLPDGEPIAKELRLWLQLQREDVLNAIPEDRIPDRFPDLDDAGWNDPMASSMTPLLGSYWDYSGKQVYSILGLDPDDWSVVNPHLKAQIEHQAFAFCQSTNESTSDRLDVALRRLKEAFMAGLVDQGETLKQLRVRVNDIFDGLSKSHAAMIAATEASRAVHAAEITADRESGVVAGVELLLSGDACPLCRKIATECKRVRLGDRFAVIGDNPRYRDIRHPPLHPHCQCTIIEVLKPEYGGPVNPEWGKTLDQPQKGLGGEYKPPKGKTEPKPEPKRKEEPPKPTQPPPAKPKAPAAAKTPIQEAFAYAKARGVPVHTQAHDILAKRIKPSQLQDVPAAYNSTVKAVLINERQPYWQDPAGWMKRVNAKQPPWFSTSEPDHIIVHEVGHAIHNRAVGDKRYDEIKDEKFTAAEKAIVAQHVSRYAATRPIEFVAEVYAGLAQGRHYNSDVTLLYLRFGGPLPS